MIISKRRRRMNSEWVPNKIGFENFWYYDEQEYYFMNGRMLLRGQNGSGKSVTMQSILPMLLDGDMRPERLDPFGSRDRKIANYLLEEEDEREERTAYIFIEFKREESDTYLTVGTGIRARKGKTTNKWYFSLTDGRRVNRDFKLYREGDQRITLSQSELEKRIGLSGGKVIDNQTDYMEYVNQQLFGFSSLEEYKELLNLLIQVRTPKLSKEFKPSIINEILSESLQPLSEDDLRPMSEAIENMDTYDAQLTSRRSSKEAAEKIGKVYDKYNNWMLYQKAKTYQISQDHLKSAYNTLSKIENQSKEYEMIMLQGEEQQSQLELEQITLEKEKESLDARDAIKLKERETGLNERIQKNMKNLKSKEEQHDDKNDKLKELYSNLKQEKQQLELKESKIIDTVELMGEHIEEIGFEEYDFMVKDIKTHMEKEYNYSIHKEMVNKLRDQIERGREKIKLAEEQKEKLNEQLLSLDREKNNRNNEEKKLFAYETQLVEVQNELKEAIYRWNGKNEELKLSNEMLKEINRFIENYDKYSDFNTLKQYVEIERNTFAEDIQRDKGVLLEDKRELSTKLEVIQNKLEEWKEKKDPEPERSEEVKRNRQWLKEQGIPYDEFYKVVDFSTKLGETECNQLEEALLLMGILDALIIDEKYKEQVMSYPEGMRDKYIFAEIASVKDNLLEQLVMSEQANDLSFNYRLSSILRSIGYNHQASTYIQDNGQYGIGILTGTNSKVYKTKFIGVKAREAYRQQMMEELTTQMEELVVQMDEVEQKIKRCEQRNNKLIEEYRSIPNDEDLRQAFQDYSEIVGQLGKIKEAIKKLEDTMAALREKAKILWNEAVQIADTIGMKCRLDLFQEARDNLEHYRDELYELEKEHFQYIESIKRSFALEENIEGCEQDIDCIAVDIRSLEKEIKLDSIEIESIRQQLSLTNYEVVKERIDYCVTRLLSLPNEIKDKMQLASNHRSKLDAAREKIEEANKNIMNLEYEAMLYSKALQEEWELGYAIIPFEVEDLYKNIQQILKHLEVIVGQYNKETLNQALNNSYFDNRSSLADYSLILHNLFEKELQTNTGKELNFSRVDIVAQYRGNKIKFKYLLKYLDEEIVKLENLIKDKDRELFEDILANTISRKIRSKINNSDAWVNNMNQLMGSMNTSSGLKLRLKWRSKSAEVEGQLDTKELVQLLKKDAKVMQQEEVDKLSKHFKSKVNEARRQTRDTNNMVSFFNVMKDTLDYRKWFEFQIWSQKNGESEKELTNSVFNKFSGGEKAMSMYVPLFSAVVAKYEGARKDAPRMISLDEAFAGVDNENIRDMFRLMVEFGFSFIINSQVLWGDCDILDGLAIYQLLRPKNVKFVTVMPYIWNGRTKKSVAEIGAVIEGV